MGQAANRKGRVAMTRKTYCDNLLWQSALTLLAMLALHCATFLLVVFCAIGILPKTVKRMSHFFSRFRLSVARVQKMGKLQMTGICKVWLDLV